MTARPNTPKRFDRSTGHRSLSRRYPSQLSGGQQQRVALARALATDPDLLLLDEPLSALDAPLRRQLRGELAQTLREWGKIAVLVTHDLAEAYQIADMVVMCEDGRPATRWQRTTCSGILPLSAWRGSSARATFCPRLIAEIRADSVVLNGAAAGWKRRVRQATRSMRVPAIASPFSCALSTSG